MIRAQISSDTYAEAEGVMVHTGSPVLALCRELVAAGYASSMQMEVYRAGTLALHVRSIGEAATLEVNAGGTGFTKASEPRSAPPMRLTALAA